MSFGPSPRLNRSTLAPSARRGFTLIELMVVIAVILMAAGLMIPSMAEFFKNRALDGVRTQITATLNSARLQAVAKNRPFVVVFFKEGTRTYDVTRGTWREDEEFDPAGAPGAGKGVHIDLVFAGLHSSCRTADGGLRHCELSQDHEECKTNECVYGLDLLPRYEDWWWVASRGGAPAPGGGEPSPPAAGTPATPGTFSIDGLVGVRYERDGILTPYVSSSLYVYDPAEQKGTDPADRGYHPAIRKITVNKKGSDVAAATYKKDEGADILAWQRGNDYVCFIDLQMTGTIASKIASGAKIIERVSSR